MVIQNAVFISDTGEIYKSWHGHDYVSFEINSVTYFIDGGNDYLRTNIMPDHPGIRWIELSDEDSVERIMDCYVSKGYEGKDMFVKLMTIPELERVLERIQHPLVKEALSILISKKISLLDMIITDP